VSKDVKIRGYFSKSKGVCEQKSLGTSDLGKKMKRQEYNWFNIRTGNCE